MEDAGLLGTVRYFLDSGGFTAWIILITAAVLIVTTANLLLFGLSWLPFGFFLLLMYTMLR